MLGNVSTVLTLGFCLFNRKLVNQKAALICHEWLLLFTKDVILINKSRAKVFNIKRFFCVCVRQVFRKANGFFSKGAFLIRHNTYIPRQGFRK